MNIFFDLDGTLIDSRKRLYLLFQHLVPKSNLSFDEYWKIKRNKVSHKEILTGSFNYTVEQYKTFEIQWMKEIELDKWLDFDNPFQGMTQYLTGLGRKHKIYVVTARQSEDVAIKQLIGYGWNGIFERIFVTCQKHEKFDLINNAVNVSKEDWFVGDTGKDIQTGKLLGINTAAVLSGFLSKEQLLGYDPDIIVENALEINF